MDDNIIFKKLWQENTLILLNVIAQSKFVVVNHNYYIDEQVLISCGKKLTSFTDDGCKKVYIQFGEKDQKYVPAFSLEVERLDDCGHLNIEVDMQIENDMTKDYRCVYAIHGELGTLYSFGQKLNQLVNAQVGFECALI